MPRFVEQIKFLVFREQDGRWQIVAEYAVQTMAEDHKHELERAGYQCGILRYGRVDQRRVTLTPFAATRRREGCHG